MKTWSNLQSVSMSYSFDEMIDLLFYGARDTTFGLPDKYRLTVMRGMHHFCMTQLCNGSQTQINTINTAYEKWAGEPYESEDDN